jgi:transcriptional regulator with XRE-family HTH domain
VPTSSAFNYRVLRPWRLHDGRTTEEICVAAKISYPYLLQLEAYGGNPSAAVLARLAAVYGRDLSELFTTDPNPAGAR